MIATGTLHRALARVTVDSHRRIKARAEQAKFYELAEREHQFQFPIKGTVGMVPVETTIKILFDIMFLYEYGYRRDSQLLEPHTRFGFTAVSAPAGTVPYAHVANWIQDEDLNYVGAHVIVGVHNPGIAVTGVEALSSTKFKCTLHASFQGYGVPLDPSDPADTGDGASNLTGVNPGTSKQGIPSDPGFTGDATVQGIDSTSSGGPSSPPLPPPQPPFVLPAYPAGALGPAVTWSVVDAFTGGGSIADWKVPPQEGKLAIAPDGHLTTADPYEVTNGYRSYAAYLAAGSVVADVGDKYAANWLKPGALAAGHKVRVHMLLNRSQGQNYLIGSVTVNMKDRQRGLAFFFGMSGVGWTTDLRLLGSISYNASIMNGPDTPGTPVDVLRGPVIIQSPRGEDPTFLLGERDTSQIHRPVILTPPGVTFLEQFNANAEATAYLRTPGVNVWIELWRKANGATIEAALYPADPASGATPIYMSTWDVSGDKQAGPNVKSHFGWTMDYMENLRDWQGVKQAPKPQGIAAMTVFKEN